MIIDSHTHINQFEEIKGESAEDLVLSMDSAGIDISMVITSNFGKNNKGPSIEKTAKFIKKYNRLKLVGNIDYSKIGPKQILKLKELITKKYSWHQVLLWI